MYAYYSWDHLFNDRFLRERGMASNPKMEYQVSLHFPKEISYGYLRYEGIFPFPSNLRYFVGGKGSKLVEICRSLTWMVPMVKLQL